MRDSALETTARAGLPPLPRSRSSRQGIWPLSVALFVVYYVTASFYVFDAGSAQPAHLIIVLLIVAMLLGLGLSWPDIGEIYWAAAIFLLWVLIVNGVWFFIVRDINLFFSFAYYLFNVLLLVLCIELRQRHNVVFDRALMAMTIVGLLVQIGYVVLSGQLSDPTGARRVGTFTNPNQLGYWTLLNLACFFLVRHGARIGWFELAVVALSLAAAALALSKAVIISICIMLVTVVVAFGLKPRILLAAGLLVPVAVAVLALDSDLLHGSMVDRLWRESEARISGIGDQQDDSLDGRGYTRLVDQYQYLLLGAGEGAYDRFDDSMKDFEIHSSFGNVLMSYGIVGLVLFVVMLGCILRGAAGYTWGLVIPVMIYGLSHQGLRFTWFWIFLGLVCTSASPSMRRGRGASAERVIGKSGPP